MHRLLRRQIRKHLADGEIPDALANLFTAIDQTYQQNDQDRELLERSLELSSRELNQRYDLIEDQLALNKAAKRDLEETLSLFDATFNATAEGILVVDNTGAIIKYNNVFARLWGIADHGSDIRDADDLLAEAFEQVVDPKTFYARISEFHRRPDAESLDIIELTDGRVLERTSRPQLNSGKVVGRVWSFRDVTAMYRTSQALRASKESLREAQHIAAVGGWEWDLGRGGLRLSPEFCALLGDEYRDDELPGDIGVLLERIPDLKERDTLQQAIESAIGDGEMFDIEHSLLDSEGRLRNFISRGKVVKSDTGQADRLLGVVHDITERKAFERRLGLARRVFEASTQGIMITDADLCVMDVNRSLCDILGLPKDALLARKLGEIHRNIGFASFYGEFVSALADSGEYTTELQIQDTEGTTHVIWANFSAILDAAGETAHYVGMFSDISQLKEAEARLEQLAYYDPLTGLANRRLFRECIETQVQRAAPAKQTLALLYIDLDRFKYVNDSLGHQAGDQLLIKVAERLRKSLRDTDRVSRQGGDEFVVALTDVDSEEAVGCTAKRLIDTLSEPFHIKEQDVYIGASIGICLMPRHADTFSHAMRKADMAMYFAKTHGKGRYAFWDQDNQAAAERRLQLEAQLREAIRHEQLVLYYQPIVDARDGAPVYMEALVRWQHPVRGLVPPDEFIPIAEEVGLIVDLENWVIGDVCRQLAQWRDEGRVPVPVSVNISAPHLNHLLEDTISAALRAHSLPATMLSIEITETLAMNDAQNTIEVLNGLTAIGIESAIDDFGTGYSSLSYLNRLPASKLKIDRSFMKEITGSSNDRGIAKAIVDLARSLSMQTVAEGVETELQLAVLREIGVDLIQGWYFGKAVPAGEAGAQLDASHNSDKTLFAGSAS